MPSPRRARCGGEKNVATPAWPAEPGQDATSNRPTVVGRAPDRRADATVRSTAQQSRGGRLEAIATRT